MNKIDKFIIKIQDTGEKILKETKAPHITVEPQTLGGIGLQLFTFGGYGVPLMVKDFSEKIRDYLNGKKLGDYDYYIDLSKYGIKRKSLIGFLYKENIRGELLETIFNLTLNPVQFNNHSENLDFAMKLDKDFAKEFSLLICKNSQRNYIQSYSSSSSTLGYLKKFKFTPDEYPILKIFFEHYSKNIKENPYAYTDVMTDFIKSSIDNRDWLEFSSYLPNSRDLQKPQETDIFIDNTQASYHLIIDENGIKSKYPRLAFTKDYKIMLEAIINLMHSHREELNLSTARITHTEDTLSYVLFLSKDETLIDNKKIKSITARLLDTYHDNIVNYSNSGQLIEFINTEFSQIALNAVLEQDLKQKSATKSLKI